MIRKTVRATMNLILSTWKKMLVKACKIIWLLKR